MKYLLLFIFPVMCLSSCMEEIPYHEKRTEKYELDCPKGYRLVFTSETEITDSDSITNTHLTVLQNGKTEQFDLKQVRSGSGVKYVTSDGKYVFWEHQGEGRFGTEDSTFCTCAFPK